MTEAMQVLEEFRPEVLALTALAGDEDRRRALAAGFQVHVAKPVDFDHLADVLLAWARPGSGPPRAGPSATIS